LEETLMSLDEALFKRLFYFVDKKEGNIAAAFDPISCALVKGGKILGLLLFAPRSDDSGAVLIHMQGREARNLYSMLGFSAAAAIERYGEEALLSFATINNFGRELGQLFKEKGFWIQAERNFI
jgi:hypothetical protein